MDKVLKMRQRDFYSRELTEVADPKTVQKPWLHNPFQPYQDDTNVHYKIVAHPGRHMKWYDDEGTERILIETDRNKQRLSDSANYTKTFGYAGSIVRKLKPPVHMLFSYCMFHLPINNDIIMLYPNDVCDWCGFVPSTFYKAVTDLVARLVLARRIGARMDFFFNPNIFYNGDRTKLVNRNKLHQII